MFYIAYKVLCKKLFTACIEHNVKSITITFVVYFHINTINPYQNSLGQVKLFSIENKIKRLNFLLTNLSSVTNGEHIVKV